MKIINFMMTNIMYVSLQYFNYLGLGKERRVERKLGP